MGAVTLEAPKIRLENVAVTDSATTAVSALGTGITLSQVTLSGAGMLGLHARFADGLTVSRTLLINNNKERFNVAPVSGGFKVGQTRGLTFRDSEARANFGPGLWTDMSVYNINISGSTFRENTSDGIFLEISAKAVVVDNYVVGNKRDGIKINNTSNVKIWNNTLVGNGRPLNLVQDSRRNTNRNDPAVDPRVPFPDPEMPWTLGPVTARNNVIADSTAVANCLLCVEDYSHVSSGQQMGISADSDVYNRRNSTSPSWIVVWSRGAGDPSVFTSLSQATAAVGQEKKGREFLSASIVDADGTNTPAIDALTADVAEPLPADVAAVAGRTAGERHLGKW
jgi:parallel beta-helix repeat protein